MLLCMGATAMADVSGDWIYSVVGTNAIITGYSGAEGAVVIPDTIEGLTVTAIGDSAFYNCTSLHAANFLGNAPATFGTDVFNVHTG